MLPALHSNTADNGSTTIMLLDTDSDAANWYSNALVSCCLQGQCSKSGILYHAQTATMALTATNKQVYFLLSHQDRLYAVHSRMQSCPKNICCMQKVLSLANQTHVSGEARSQIASGRQGTCLTSSHILITYRQANNIHFNP